MYTRYIHWMPHVDIVFPSNWLYAQWMEEYTSSPDHITISDHDHFLLPSTFTGNTGSGILLRLSYARISDNITFEGNMAENGVAIQILDESRVCYCEDLPNPALTAWLDPYWQLDLSGVTRGNFRRNRAMFSGGAIFADDTSSSVTAIEYTHQLAENNLGPCFLQFGNEFTIAQVHMACQEVNLLQENKWRA